MDQPFKKPWLVAVWPGMGGVAEIAGKYLVHKLGAQPVGKLAAESFFEPTSIVIKAGLVQPGVLPQSVFYAWRNPNGEHDLLVMLGERQPNEGGVRYAQALLEIARLHAVDRVLTFAAMATPIHPSGAPRVFAAATSPELLTELGRLQVEVLINGEISGLNGLFLGAAASREIPGICLLGEFPFFAAGVPNPKASAAVLRKFSALSGIPVELGDLDRDSERIEQSLVQLLEQMQAAGQAQQAQVPTGDSPAEGEQTAEPAESDVPEEVSQRIEQLFEQVRKDRSKALDLKLELDRRGLFRRYEDRFLDLFKQAG